MWRSVETSTLKYIVQQLAFAFWIGLAIARLATLG